MTALFSPLACRAPRLAALLRRQAACADCRDLRRAYCFSRTCHGEPHRALAGSLRIVVSSSTPDTIVPTTQDQEMVPKRTAWTVRTATTRTRTRNSGGDTNPRERRQWLDGDIA